MKRDMDLVRQILQRVEACPDPRGKGLDLAFPDRTKEEVCYHVSLMAQAGLIEAIDATTRAGLNWIPKTLTNEGHDFLDAIRNETVWSKVKDKAKELGGALPLEVLKGFAIKVAMGMVGL